MKALKVMLPDGRILAYRVKQPLAAVQMIEMSEEEFVRYGAANEAQPDVQTLFKNEGHLTVRA